MNGPGKDECLLIKNLHRRRHCLARLAGENSSLSLMSSSGHEPPLIPKREPAGTPRLSTPRPSSTSCCCGRLQQWVRDFHVGFVHIPKNGGSSIENTLRTASACHATAGECEACDRQAWNRSFTFATVRNPLARLVSAFEYTGGSMHNGSLAAFVQDEMIATRLMTRTQLSFLRRDGDETDEIGVRAVLHLENLEAEWRALSSRMPLLPPQLLGESTRVTRHVRIRHNATPWCAYYTTPDVLAAARRVYDEDIRWLLRQPPDGMPRATVAGLDFDFASGDSMCAAVQRTSGQVEDAWRFRHG